MLNVNLKSNNVISKYFFVLIILLPFHLISYCQSSNTFLVANKEWSTTHWSDADGKYRTIRYRILDDTIIDSTNYFKLLRNFNEQVPINWYLYGFIREDSVKRVYFKRETVNDFSFEEHILYDFNLKLSDTLNIYTHAAGTPFDITEIYVSNVDTLFYSNHIYKSYLLKPTIPDNYRNTWIETIGSLHGLLTNIYPFIYDGLGGYELLCCKINDSIYYQNPKYESCFYSTTNMTLLENNNANIIIYPNPISENSILEISCNNYEELRIEIYNAFGAKLITKKLQGFQTTLDESQFAPGIYIVKVLNDKDLKGIRRFIVY